jgi:hypothetical protein
MTNDEIPMTKRRLGVPAPFRSPGICFEFRTWSFVIHSTASRFRHSNFAANFVARTLFSNAPACDTLLDFRRAGTFCGILEMGGIAGCFLHRCPRRDIQF